jgi:hypothetical protein
VEARFSHSSRYSETKGLQDFVEEYPETVAGIFVYDGTEVRGLHERIVAIPWKSLGSPCPLPRK